MLRTCRHTLAAGFAGFAIHDSNSVYDVNCIKRTGLHAGTISETSVGAAFCAAVLHLACHDAVLDSGIFIFRLCFFTCSAAFHKSDFPFLSGSVNSHDLSDLFCNRSAAHRAAAHFCFSRHDGCCQTGTSRVSAAAAVVAGKNIKNCVLSLVCLNSELLSGNTEEDTDEQTCAADNYGC